MPESGDFRGLQYLRGWRVQNLEQLLLFLDGETQPILDLTIVTDISVKPKSWQHKRGDGAGMKAADPYRRSELRDFVSRPSSQMLLQFSYQQLGIRLWVTAFSLTSLTILLATSLDALLHADTWLIP